MTTGAVLCARLLREAPDSFNVCHLIYSFPSVSWIFLFVCFSDIGWSLFPLKDSHQDVFLKKINSAFAPASFLLQAHFITWKSQKNAFLRVSMFAPVDLMHKAPGLREKSLILYTCFFEWSPSLRIYRGTGWLLTRVNCNSQTSSNFWLVTKFCWFSVFCIHPLFSTTTDYPSSEPLYLQSTLFRQRPKCSWPLDNMVWTVWVHLYTDIFQYIL